MANIRGILSAILVCFVIYWINTLMWEWKFLLFPLAPSAFGTVLVVALKRCSKKAIIPYLVLQYLLYSVALMVSGFLIYGYNL